MAVSAKVSGCAPVVLVVLFGAGVKTPGSVSFLKVAELGISSGLFCTPRVT